MIIRCCKDKSDNGGESEPNERTSQEKSDGGDKKEEVEEKPITEQEAEVRDALIDLLGEAIGKENVITDDEQAQRIIDRVKSEEVKAMSCRQKKLLDTATMISEESQTNKATAISSNSGVKLLQNFGNPTKFEQK